MTDAGVSRSGTRLGFSGRLDRAASARVWAQAQPLLDGVREIDLGAVSAVDSAGLALLGVVAARCDGATLVGTADGLDALRAAYRLDERLDFAG